MKKTQKHVKKISENQRDQREILFSPQITRISAEKCRYSCLVRNSEVNKDVYILSSIEKEQTYLQLKGIKAQVRSWNIRLRETFVRLPMAGTG